MRIERAPEWVVPVAWSGVPQWSAYMPVSYWLDEQLRILFEQWDGFLALRDVQNFLARYRSEIPGDFDMLVDLSAVTETDITSAQIESFARRPVPSSRIAIVAPRPGLYGSARMYQILAEIGGRTSEVGVFKTQAEALLWLADGRR